MLGIGFWEMLVIGVLVLVAVGPDRLPGMIKQISRFYRQFRRTAEDLRASTGIDDLLRDEELKELAELRKQKLASLTAPPPKAKPPVDKVTAEKTDAPIEKAPVEKAPVEKAPVEKAPVEKAAPVESSGAASETALAETSAAESAATVPSAAAAAPSATTPAIGWPMPGQPHVANLAAAAPVNAMVAAHPALAVEPEAMPIPRTRGGVSGAPSFVGLDKKALSLEVPPEGVDVFEARRLEPEVTDDEIALRKQRIAAKLAGLPLDDIKAGAVKANVEAG